MEKENKIKHYDIKVKVVYDGDKRFKYKPFYYRFIVRALSMQEARNQIINGVKRGLGGDEEAKNYKISIERCAYMKINGIANLITEK
ncbi:hypothetical protein EDM00_10190 [Ornithobacterium rhinotracheale]|uniref:hypothetical protein n=1 Tax=Ornithobacterium rhinotracheale TaxID=28251 RepID=UPI00129CB855|nr:hypothetical protein [Ornithobacterium rhinotracheale]MRI64352.1 hypothetical protein [Ornithobacterium rhinotracheale]